MRLQDKAPDCETVGEISQEYNVPLEELRLRMKRLGLPGHQSTMPRCDLCQKKGPVHAYCRLDVCSVCRQERFRNTLGVPLGRIGRCHLCQNSRYLHEIRALKICPSCKNSIIARCVCKKF